MEIKVFNGNWNMDLQAQQTDQAINERPDMIVFAPGGRHRLHAAAAPIHQAGIPCITSNTIPCDEAMKYCLAWTGPGRLGPVPHAGARASPTPWARQGGYAIVRHMPGSSPFFARTFAPITELREYAPDMKLLAMDTANLEAEGDHAAGLRLAHQVRRRTEGARPGRRRLLHDRHAGGASRRPARDDIVIVAAGNSKTGMDSVKAGEALAITYQSAEGDGALAVHSAARWFNGETSRPGGLSAQAHHHATRRGAVYAGAVVGTQGRSNHE